MARDLLAFLMLLDHFMTAKWPAIVVFPQLMVNCLTAIEGKWSWILLIVAAIIYALYSTLSICIPTQTPCVHLQVQSSECHVLLASATEAVRGSLSLRIVRPNVPPGRTIWNIMHEWPASARSCTVNSELGLTMTIDIGMQYECLCMPCDMLWCPKWMFVCVV